MTILIMNKKRPQTAIRLSAEEAQMLEEVQKITGEKISPLVKRMMRLQLREELKRLEGRDPDEG